ncbi:MAG TPA: PQQ-binding-like beta-propeller repeat protein [Steroidobacteraceae bacterium]|jgi:outer membrane protein assembly factor BamB|nr:PQQ-binding-like beta-propeller repeat protein [Steroidobacteraceae bacterium]
MKILRMHALACLAAFTLALPATAQDAVKFSDIAGWWSADPEFGGESSHLAMQFLEKDGKQEAHVWLMAIGAYDINLGAVAINGNSVDSQGLSFPLTWNPEKRTLSGVIPAEAAPIYNIPVEFRRSGPAEKPAPREWKAPRPQVLWTAETGAAVWAGIERADDGTLFVGNENGDLNAIGRDGKLRWKFSTGKPIRAQPKVIGKFVYLHSDSGYLHQLDRKTGAETWRADVDDGSEPRIPTDNEKTRWDRYGSSVVTDGRRLFVASRDKNLYAIDMRTGRESWRVAAADIMTATPALHGDLVIFAALDGKVQAVSAKDGQPRWSYDAKLGIGGDVVVSGDRVLVGSRTYDLVALDAATGKELWKHYYWFSWIESPPVVRDGVVYTGSSDATHVYAIDLADGSLRWKSPVPGYSWQRTAVTEQLVVAGTVGQGAIPGARNGSLLALDRASGALRWMHQDAPSEATVKARGHWGFGASPVIADGVVYAADLNGRVYAIAL